MEFLDISSIEGSQNSIYNSVEDHGKEILILTIDIGQGKTDEIVIREHDTPRFIAKEFCRKHKLNPEAEKVLIDVIKQHIHIKPTVEVSNANNLNNKNIKSSSASEPEIKKNEVKPTPNLIHQEPEVKTPKTASKPNFGERLYTVGLMHKEKHEKKISEIRDKLNKEKMKDITFRPNITPERKMPRLNLLQSEPNKPVDRCQILYKKAQKSPSPAISPSKITSSSSVLSQKVISSRKNLQHYLEIREQNPKTPIRSRSPVNKSRVLPKKTCRSQSHELKVKLSNEQTDKILTRIKTIRFIQLFEILNPNENQEINKNTIIKAKLPKLISKILEPFFNELQSLSYGLNLEHFCKVMELYIKELTPEERSYLLQIGKRRPSPKNKNLTLSKELPNDLWSPKYEEKLLAFDNFPDLIEKD
jgi:hypothetical protein